MWVSSVSPHGIETVATGRSTTSEDKNSCPACSYVKAGATGQNSARPTAAGAIAIAIAAVRQNPI